MPKVDLPDVFKVSNWKSKKGALPADGDLVTKLTTLKTKYDAVDWKPFADGWAAAAADEATLDDALATRKSQWAAKVGPLKDHAEAVSLALKTPRDGKKASVEASRALNAALAKFTAEITAGPAAMQKEADSARPPLQAKALRASQDKGKGRKEPADEPDEAVARLIDPKRVLSLLQNSRRKPDVRVQFAFADGDARNEPMLAMHATTSGRSMLEKLQKETPVKAGSHGEAWVSGKDLKLRLGKAFSGLPKKMQPLVKRAGFRVARILVVGDDGAVLEQEAEPRDEGTFGSRLRELFGRSAQASGSGAAKQLFAEAGEHAKRKEWEPAHRKLDEAEALLPDSDEGDESELDEADLSPQMARKVAFERERFQQREAKLSPAMERKMRFEQAQFAQRQRGGESPANPMPEAGPAKASQAQPTNVGTAAHAKPAKGDDAAPAQVPKDGAVQPGPAKDAAAQAKPVPAKPSSDREFVTGEARTLVPRLGQLLKRGVAESAALKQSQAALVAAVSAGKFDTAAPLIRQLQAQIAVIEQRLRQEDTAARLGEVLGRVKATSFPDGAADRFAKEKLSPGKEFEAFRKALKAFEQKRDRASLDAMTGLAQAYIAHVKAMPAKDQTKSERPRKLQICETQLKLAQHWRLGDDFEQLGPPPWDFAKQNKAGALRTRMLFEEGDRPGRQLADDEGGVTQAWWVDEVEAFGADQLAGAAGAPKVPDALPDADKTQRKRRMIFKPVDGEKPEKPGFQPGMSAPREVMAKVLSDQLAASTGLETGVCPTFLASLSNERLAGADGQVDPSKPAQRVGSVQQLAANNGSLGERLKKDPSNDAVAKVYASVPKASFDKQVILDMMTLNLDRHTGNFLLQDQPGGSAELVPIDHGFAFPTRETLDALRRDVGRNALMSFPQASQMLSDEAQRAVDQIDPDAIAKAMADARTALEADHPEVRGKMSDEAIEISRRATLFLKAAARELTPAEMAYAHAYHQPELLDAKPGAALDAAIRSIISKVKAHRAEQADAADLVKVDAQTDLAEVEKVKSNLLALGWDYGARNDNGLRRFLQTEPGRVAKILRGRIVNPRARQAIDDGLKVLGADGVLPANLRQLPINKQIDLITRERRRLQRAAPSPAPAQKRDEQAAKRVLEGIPKAELELLERHFQVFQPDDPDSPTPDLAVKRAKAYDSYLELKKLGGLPAVLARGIDTSVGAEGVLDDLRDALRLEAELAVVDATSADDARAAQKAFLQSAVDYCVRETAKVRKAAARGRFETEAARIAPLLQAGRLDAAQSVVMPLQRLVQLERDTEEADVARLQAGWKAFEQRLAAAGNTPAIAAFRKDQAKVLGGIDALLQVGQFAEAEKQTKDLDAELAKALAPVSG